MEVVYLSGMSMWDKEYNEDVYERFDRHVTPKEVHYGVVDEVRCGNLRWYGYEIRMNDDFFEEVLRLWPIFSMLGVTHPHIIRLLKRL